MRKVLGLACGLTALGWHAGAEPLICSDGLVSVEAPTPALAERTCGAAELATTTLGACGIALGGPLRIDVREKLSEPDCLGLYHCGEAFIEVLTPAALDIALGDGPFTGVDRARFWDSVVVHEIAHAVYDKVPCPYASCLGTSEYFAYTAQIRALPAKDRQVFEAATGVEGKVSGARLSAMLATMAPDRFAGLAWAHLSQRPDTCDYLQLVARGTIFFDSERP